MLGSHLKEIQESFPLRWALELMMSHGKFEERTVSNGMFITGIDYSFFDNTHQFYFEATYKNVGKLTDDNLLNGDLAGLDKKVGNNGGFGFREAFYRFSLASTQLTVGLQSMTLGDEMLMDERVLGISFDQKIGAFDLKFRVGSVENSFSRMGDFCGSRKIFNLTRKTQAADELWKTDLSSFVIAWDPNYEVPQTQEENSYDDFEDFEDFEDVGVSKSIIRLEEVGLVAYQEFGEGFPYEKYWYGGFVNLKIPLDIDMKLELLGQSVPNHSAIIYFAELHKNIFWTKAGNLDMKAGYFGKLNIDKQAQFMATFSHLYLGEVMRLDGRDIPVAYGSVIHTFPWDVRVHFKVTAISQIKKDRISEIDFELGVLIFNHIKLTPIYSYITSKNNDPMSMVRLEIRGAI